MMVASTNKRAAAFQTKRPLVLTGPFDFLFDSRRIPLIVEESPAFAARLFAPTPVVDDEQTSGALLLGISS